MAIHPLECFKSYEKIKVNGLFQSVTEALQAVAISVLFYQ